MDLFDVLYRITQSDKVSNTTSIRITHDNYNPTNLTDIRFRLENELECRINFYQEDGDELDNLYICRDTVISLLPCNKPRYLEIIDGYFICPYNMRIYS